MNKTQVIKKAKERAKQLDQIRKDPRTLHVLGKYKHQGWIHDENIKPVRTRLYLDDILWVGENLEPRVLELLPAIFIKKRGTLICKEIPDDLRLAVNNLKKGILDGEFRGIPLKSCYQWLNHIGRKNKWPSVLVSYRLQKNDFELLSKLQTQMKISKSNIIREALKILAEKEQIQI